MFAEICRSNVMLGGHGGLPSKHRIGSTTGANADQAGGIMLHGTLIRGIRKSFQKWNQALPGDDDGDDDYRKMVRKKLWRVLHSIDPQHIVHRLTVCYMSSKLDHLWMVIQRLDAQGHMIRIVAHRSSSPFAQAVRDYTEILTSPLDHGHLKSLMYHVDFQFENGFWGVDDNLKKDDIIDQLRLLGCSIACQITWRTVWFFDGLPFRGYLMVDSRLSEEQQLDVGSEIFHAPPCELDPFFWRKVALMIDF